MITSLTLLGIILVVSQLNYRELLMAVINFETS